MKVATYSSLLMLLVGVNAAHAAVLDEAAERYRPYAIAGIADALKGAQAVRERAAAGDLAGAKNAWISAHAGWERSEVFTTGFAAELGTRTGASPCADIGFHTIEARLFGDGQTDIDKCSSELVRRLETLHTGLKDMKLSPQGLLDGVARLAHEIGERKADGGESRISGTSLDDMRNNVAGIDLAYHTVFSDALNTAEGRLDAMATAEIEQLQGLVASPNLEQVDVSLLRSTSAALVTTLQAASAKLGLERPKLEAQSR